MNDILISQFIDNELDLDTKIDFVHQVAEDQGYAAEALALLRQERRLRAPVAYATPAVELPGRRRSRFPLWRPVTLALAGLAAGILLMLGIMPATEPGPASFPHRFVIYRPDAAQVRIAGSFTAWQSVPLNRIGESGYWEVELEVGPGEHRYAFILGELGRVTDPTVPVREADDFGGYNSILTVAAAS